MRKCIDKSADYMYNVIVANAVVAQSVEHFLGKEEVGSSNLLNSSKNRQARLVLVDFYFLPICFLISLTIYSLTKIQQQNLVWFSTGKL